MRLISKILLGVTAVAAIAAAGAAVAFTLIHAMPILFVIAAGIGMAAAVAKGGLGLVVAFEKDAEQEGRSERPHQAAQRPRSNSNAHQAVHGQQARPTRSSAPRSTAAPSAPPRSAFSSSVVPGSTYRENPRDFSLPSSGETDIPQQGVRRRR